MLAVEPLPEYSLDNERQYREDVRRRLEKAYKRNAHVILPFGYDLGFTGASGEQVVFNINGDGEFVLNVDGTDVFVISPDQAAFALNNGGRVTGLVLNGVESTIDFLATSLRFFDGVTDRALISAGGGLFTINGDLAVRGSIVVGDVRWPVALKPAPFYVADGGTIQWASGAALSTIPDFTITVPGGVALAAGEAWEPPTIQSATTTGGTLRLKISTPGATSSVTDTGDTAGGGGDPDRVMAKTDAADAYDGIYNFRVVGTIAVVGTYETEILAYINTGSVTLSTWFNDGGGWDEGPSIYIEYFAQDIINQTGNVAFDETFAVNWANAIGQHGGYEWGASHESGGALTDLFSVQYTKQSATGVRTGSPNGETATILVIPKNV